jgi:DNA-binding NarL/FixJ family response regulator
LVADDRPDRVRDAIAVGCSGAVSSSASIETIVSAVESLATGQSYVDPALSGQLLARNFRGDHLRSVDDRAVRASARAENGHPSENGRNSGA